MDHFSLESWLDLARGLSTTPERERMQMHLDQGCSRCQRTLAMWTLMLEQGRREPEFSPSDEDVQRVKRAFQNRTADRTPLVLDWAKLVFDSLLQPNLAAVRSGITSSRQLLYESGALVIDIHIQPEAGERKSFVMGQILTSGETVVTNSRIRVSLRKGPIELEQVMASDGGEFEFRINNEPDLHLWIQLPDRDPISLALPNERQRSNQLETEGGITG